MWWSRTLDARSQGEPDTEPGWSEWRNGLSILRGEVLGTEQARTDTEARYLDGRDCLFPELAVEWAELRSAAELMSDTEADPVEASARDRADQRLRTVVLMARADALDASGQWANADGLARMAMRVASHAGGGHG